MNPLLWSSFISSPLRCEIPSVLLSRTKCLCPGWVPLGVGTGYLTFLHHSHRRTCPRENRSTINNYYFSQGPFHLHYKITSTDMYPESYTINPSPIMKLGAIHWTYYSLIYLNAMYLSEASILWLLEVLWLVKNLFIWSETWLPNTVKCRNFLSQDNTFVSKYSQHFLAQWEDPLVFITTVLYPSSLYPHNYLDVIYSHLPVMPDKFYFVTCMASLDAVNTDGISVGCVACPTPVEVMHWETRITWNLIKTLATRHCLLYHVLVTKDFVFCKEKVKKGVKSNSLTLTHPSNGPFFNMLQLTLVRW